MKMLPFASAVLATLLIAGCEGDSSPFEEAVEIRDQNIISLNVIPPASSVDELVLNSGESVEFGVQGVNTAAQVIELTASDRQWQVTNTAVAAIDEDGRLVAQADGEVGVFVTIGGLDSDVFDLRVSTANLVGVNSILGDEQVDRCIPADYQATGDYDDLSTRDLTAVEWSLAAADEGLARIVSNPDINVTLTGLDDSIVTLTATAGGFSLQRDITISDTLSSIAITPGAATVDVDDTQNFVATGTYTGTTADEQTESRVEITQSVDWEVVTGRTVASVSNTDGTRGQVTGVEVGSATLSASCGTLAAETAAVVTVDESEDELSFNRDDPFLLSPDSSGVFLRVSPGSTYSASDQLDNDDLDWEFTRIGDEDAIELTTSGDNAGFIVPLINGGEGTVTVTDSNGVSASIDIEVTDN